jgi:sugar/nucleoside kinase (ribokinase family)
MLSGETNSVRAAEKVLAMGPKSLVVKHGEYGATAFFGDRSFFGAKAVPRPFRAPALPLAEVVDPTGAGDSFAGGFYGYLASQPELTPAVFRRAMFYGGVMGSFAVERFGTERLQAVTREEINARFEIFREISHLDLAAV